MSLSELPSKASKETASGGWAAPPRSHGGAAAGSQEKSVQSTLGHMRPCDTHVRPTHTRWRACGGHVHHIAWGHLWRHAVPSQICLYGIWVVRGAVVGVRAAPQIWAAVCTGGKNAGKLAEGSRRYTTIMEFSMAMEICETIYFPKRTCVCHPSWANKSPYAESIISPWL